MTLLEIFSILIILTCLGTKSQCNNDTISKEPADGNASVSVNASTAGKIAPVNNTSNSSKLPFELPEDPIKSGALLRGLYVLIGVTVLLVIYFAFRVMRVRSGKPPPLVRKYGVLTKRSDVEMLPLPLDDDEEEDTVFERPR